jgi:hypothetical protein
MRLIYGSALLVSLICIPFVTVGSASTLTYSFTGNASGSLNGSSFADALLTITAVGDTSSVSSSTLIGSGFYQIDFSAATTSFSLAGIGGGTFSDPTYIYDFQYAPFQGSLGFGTGGNGDVIQIHGTDFGSTAFMTYNLMGSIGPLGYVTDPSVGDWGPPIYPAGSPTSLGALVVTGLTNTAFQAGPSEASVPEPTAISLGGLGFGLFAFIAARRRFGRRCARS